jgi:uncharacterized protein with von Willebrand factor type A (vWA) domain
VRQEYPELFAFSIVAFCRFLRGQGFNAGMRQLITALDAARIIGADMQGFLFALQAALCTNGEEWERFPRLFRQFWDESPPDPRTVPGDNKRRTKGESSNREDGATMFAGKTGPDVSGSEGTQRAIYGASAQQRLRKVDFSEIPTDDLPALEEISIRLLRRMSRRISRRLAISTRASRLDLRRSIRRSIAHGGEMLALAYKARKLVRNNFVILIDISGSMNFYSMFLVRFAFALQSQFARVQTFLFSTGVVPISDLLRGRNLKEALRGLSQRAAGWSGGTKIGESLHEFRRDHGRLLRRDTVLMILSDGWETGAPELLGDEMRAASRRVFKVIWLNPLLGLKEYQPVTRGMAAALPYVDVFAPAHNLESLLALEKRL